MSKLHEKDYGNDGSGKMGVKWWATGSKDAGGKPLRRLRMWDLEDRGMSFRVIFIYDFSVKEFHVLGIVHRDEFDYDDRSNQLRARIMATVRRDFKRA